MLPVHVFAILAVASGFRHTKFVDRIVLEINETSGQLLAQGRGRVHLGQVANGSGPGSRQEDGVQVRRFQDLPWDNLRYDSDAELVDGSMLIPTLSFARKTFPLDFSLRVKWRHASASASQIWEVGSYEDPSSKRFPIVRVTWAQEEGRPAHLSTGVAVNLKGERIFLVRQLDEMPAGSPPYSLPRRSCAPSVQKRAAYFCVQPPSADPSHACLYTFVKSNTEADFFVFKLAQAGNKMVLQSQCIEAEMCVFNSASCPGRKTKDNPWGFDEGQHYGFVTYYQEVSPVETFETKDDGDGNDIAMLLALSSLKVHLGLVRPSEWDSAHQDPDVKALTNDVVEAHRYPAPDISMGEFLSHLIAVPWHIGNASDALFPKMVTPDSDELPEFQVQKLSFDNHFQWAFVDQAGQSGVLAQLEWVKTSRPKRMILSSGGRVFLEVKQAPEPPGSLGWRVPAGCGAKRRPRARANRFFCVVPAGSTDNTPCLFTFQGSKAGGRVFVFRGQDMVYQMDCIGSGYEHCSFHAQDCPGRNRTLVTVGHLSLLADQAKVTVKALPHQDLGLFMVIGTMILEKKDTNFRSLTEVIGAMTMQDTFAGATFGGF